MIHHSTNHDNEKGKKSSDTKIYRPAGPQTILKEGSIGQKPNGQQPKSG
jgi:hypothetical protein